MSTQRVVLGRDVSLRAETAEGVDLEGAARLRPGRPVEIVREGHPGDLPRVRLALVCSWAVRSLGSAGPTYGGFCQWT
jgi:hypothetical protein